MSRIMNFLGAVIGFAKSATVRLRLSVSVTGSISPTGPGEAKPRLKVRLAAAARFALAKFLILLWSALKAFLVVGPGVGLGFAIDFLRVWLGDLFWVLVALLPSLLAIFSLWLTKSRCRVPGRRRLTIIVGKVSGDCIRVLRFEDELKASSPATKAAIAALCHREMGFLVPSVEEAIAGDPKALSKFNVYALDETSSGAERAALSRAREILEPRVFSP